MMEDASIKTPKQNSSVKITCLLIMTCIRLVIMGAVILIVHSFHV